MEHQENKAQNGGGCCGRKNRSLNANYIASPTPDYTNYTGRSSCHQRKMERRAQRQFQRAERSRLRAEQRAERNFQRTERRQARWGVQSGGEPRVENVVPAVRSFQEEPKDAQFETDAPPSYDEAARK